MSAPINNADDPRPSFYPILERYVHRVATGYIEYADQATQDSLIGLINRISDCAGNADLPCPLSLQPEQTEWAQVLQKPVDWRSVHRQWLLGISAERAKRQEGYVARLKQAITLTEQHLQQARTVGLPASHCSDLVARYERILASYQLHLDQAVKLH